jgi:hypothetical protein
MTRQHSMDCVDFKVLLSPYIDGELAAEARFSADRHLIECTACRTLLEQAESNDEAIRSICQRDPEFAQQIAGTVALPDEFEAGVLDRVRRRRTVQWQRMRGSLGLLAAAAAIALGAALWTIWSTQSSGPRNRTSVSEPVSEDDVEPLDPSLHGPPKSLRGREFVRSAPNLTMDESQSLHSAALLLESIVGTPFENLPTRTRLRDMARYDELIERLGAIQPRFDTIDRRSIAAARAVLFELQREHLDLAAWNAMQDDLRTFELSHQLEVLAASAEIRNDA